MFVSEQVRATVALRVCALVCETKDCEQHAWARLAAEERSGSASGESDPASERSSVASGATQKDAVARG